MRFIIYMLILANVAFYAWHVYNPGPTPQAGYQPPPFPAGVKTLVLLKERREQGGEAPTGNAGSKASSGATDKSQRAAPAASPKTPPTGAAGQASPGNDAENDAPATTNSNAPSPAAPKRGDGPASGASATPGRHSPQDPAQGSGPTGDVAGSGSEAGTAASCYRLGPLSDAAAAAALSTRLAQQGLNATVNKVQSKQQDGYWVFLPPMSHEKALGISEDLSSKGIKDYFIGKDNYISLGIFNGPQSAEQRRQQIADMGYAPKVEKHFTTQTQYWLAVRVDADTSVSKADWERVLSATPDVHREPTGCD